MTKEPEKREPEKKAAGAPPIDVTDGQYHGYTLQQAQMIENAREQAKASPHGGAVKGDEEDDPGVPSPNEPPGSTVWEGLPEYVPPPATRKTAGEMPVSRKDAASQERERADDHSKKHK